MFIELTVFHGSEFRKEHINMSNVSYFCQRDEEFTLVVLGNGYSYREIRVKETPQEIMRLINPPSL